MLAAVIFFSLSLYSSVRVCMCVNFATFVVDEFQVLIHSTTQRKKNASMTIIHHRLIDSHI